MDVWNLENHRIEGTYHGVPFSGTVVLSRVCYGSQPAIEHTVLLEHPITVYNTPRTLITVKTSDSSDIAEYAVTDF